MVGIDPISRTFMAQALCEGQGAQARHRATIRGLKSGSLLMNARWFSLTMCVIKISKPLIIPLFPECDLDTVFLSGKYKSD